MEAVLVLMVGLLASVCSGGEPAATQTGGGQGGGLVWSRLADLPDREGFAGMFAGTSGGSLMVAGGANFPRGFPWEGGKKVWYNTIYLLADPQGSWEVAREKLPRPLAYGVTVSWQDRLICVGGCDQEKHYADVFSIRRTEQGIEFESLPSLPHPCANMCGCLVGSRIFVAGGTESPESTVALRTFWSLDLSEPREKQVWEVLEPWPGLERSHAVAAEWNGSFYLFSGFRWKAGPQGEQERLLPFLKDLYCFTPAAQGSGGTWKKLSDLPQAMGAAPSPAFACAPGRIIVVGGIDERADLPERSTHPGFATEVFQYEIGGNRWSFCTKMPAGSARVTAAGVVWNGRYYVISGERAPGRRSPQVLGVGG